MVYLMASVRGVDPEWGMRLCRADTDALLQEKQKDHAEAWCLAGEFSQNNRTFFGKEIEVMAAAINHHSKKSEIGTPMEEIVKDADVIDFYQYGFGFSREEQKQRYERLVDGEGRLKL